MAKTAKDILNDIRIERHVQDKWRKGLLNDDDILTNEPHLIDEAERVVAVLDMLIDRYENWLHQEKLYEDE